LDARELSAYIIAGDAVRAAEATQKALDEGVDSAEIVDNGLIPPMEVVGQRFSTGEIYVPEMLVAALAMKRCLEILRPVIAARGDAESRGKVVIGTVKGDIHDIGKNLVSGMLEGAGFEVCDIGVDVSPETFVEAVHSHQPDVLGLSALLTATMPMMRTVIEALDVAGLRSSVKVLVGGAPITEEYAKQIAADAYAPNAPAAAQVARTLVSMRKADSESVPARTAASQ